MAPGPKRQRVFNIEEARELVTLAEWRRDSDSEAEGAEESSDDESNDESLDYSPTRSVSRELPQDNEPVDFAHDSDSEAEEEVGDDEGDRKERMKGGSGLEMKNGTPRGMSPTLTNPNFCLTLPKTTTVQLTFFQYFPEHLFTVIANETNRYSDECLATHRPFQKHSRYRKWTYTDAPEIKAFTALQIAMGLVSKPAKQMFWEEDWLVGTPGFGQVMSRNR